MIVLTALFICIPFFLTSQDSITVNLVERSITISLAPNELKNTAKNWLDEKNYTFIKSDTSYTRYYYDCKKNILQETDTFHYISTEIFRKKNSIFVIPRSREKQICLNKRLKELSFYEKDSLLNAFLKEEYKWQPSSTNMFNHFKISSVQYYKKKYPYIDIKEVFRERRRKKNLYTSIATRILIIDGVHYFISVKSESLKSAKSITSSRKAVCCDFNRLVNNIQIIDE
jgi:hypothetical protein